MIDVERGEIGAHRRHHHLDRLGAHDGKPFGLGLLCQRVFVLRGECGTDRLEIIAGIQAFGNRTDVLAERLAVAQIGRAREHIDLGAGVVDVIFARYLETGEGEQVRQRIAEHGAAAMADMHRPGRIGRDIFDVDRNAAADVAHAVSRAQLHRAAQRRDPGGGLEREIDEARAGDVDLVDDSIGTKFFGDRLGKLARFAAGVLGQHHGSVGGDIAMRRIARRLDGHARLIDAAGQQRPRWRGGRESRMSAKMFFVVMLA